jgi:pimeloyl-ACP methyl ester carboxylesterase
VRRAADRHLLVTADAVRLSALHVPVTQPGADGEVAVVLAHGFGGGLHRPALQAVIGALSRRAGVVALDLRGHGRSEGLSTLGDLEVLDVDAAVGWARDLGYREVVTLGFSMGGAAVLRHGGLTGAPAPDPVPLLPTHPSDVVVAVSTGSRWFQLDTRPMRRVHWFVLRPTGRRVARVWPGVRIASSGWDPVPAAPAELVDRIPPRPLLLVHGDADPYFPARHLDELAAAAGPAAEIWLEPGFGHAEVAMPPALLDRLAARAVSLARERIR